MDFPWGRAHNVAFRYAIGSAFRGEKSMGLAMSVPQLLIILVIVALIFGTKRLKEVGGDLGSAIKSFKKAMAANENEDEPPRDPKQISSEAGQPADKREQHDRQQN
jgi:sec-independent protein translocase protein TatA